MSTAANKTPQAWRGPAGSLTVQRLTPQVVLVTMQGSVSEDAVPFINTVLAAELRTGTALHTFWDLGELTWYHTQIRVQTTKAIKDNLARITDLHVFVRSKLVAMGVSVANLALENRIRVVNTQNDFQRSLDAAVSAQGAGARP
mgnify:CR=1 FL=1